MRRTQLFASLPEDLLARLAQSGHRRRYEAGSVVFREGDDGASAFVVTQGEIAVMKGDPDAGDVIAVLRTGAVFGEMAMLGGETRSATCVAHSEDAVCLEISSAAFRGVFEDAPAALWNVVPLLVERLKATTDRLTQSMHQVQSQNLELRQAAQKLEAEKQSLSAETRDRGTRKKMIAAAAAVVVLTLGFVLFSSPDASDVESSSADLPSQVIEVSEQSVERTLVLTGKLEPLGVVNVVAPFDGMIKERPHPEGAIVKPGDLLIRLDTQALEDRIFKQRKVVEEATRELGSLRNWQRGPEVTKARRALANTEAELRAAERDLRSSELLFQEGIAPQSEVEAARRNLGAVQAQYSDAKQALAAVIAQGGATELAAAQRNHDDARASLAVLEARRNESEIRAEALAFITRLPPGSAERVGVGRSVSEGTLLMSLGLVSGRSIEAQVDELDVALLKPGMRAKLTNGQGKEYTFEAVVKAVSLQPLPVAEGGTFSLYPVTLEVENLSLDKQGEARLGATVDAAIVVYQNPRALVAPLGAVYYVGDQAHVDVALEGSDVEARAVRVGQRFEGGVEIVEGLAVGDRIRAPL